MKFFRKKANFFKKSVDIPFGDTAVRLQKGLVEDVERIVNAAVGDNVSLVDELDKKLKRDVRARVYSVAKTEAAMARNGIIVKSYHKAGFHAVWKASPTCCEPCRKLNGVVVSTLTPPLHKGCACTVTRGKRISVSEMKNPLDIAAKYAKLKAKQEDLGIYGVLNYPPVPLEFSLGDYHLTTDPSHARRTKEHGVDIEEAREFADKALFSIKRHYKNTQYYYTCYFSENGASYATDSHPVFRTAFHNRDYDLDTMTLVKEAAKIVRFE